MDKLDGLAYSLWLPEDRPRGGVVILHGAGSCKENHHDFARALRAAGFGAIALDLRGHGESDGALDDRVLEDIAAMAAYLKASLGQPATPIGLRGRAWALTSRCSPRRRSRRRRWWRSARPARGV
jgi:alpha-beta hydrolase superfamily lysophospholipase